MVTTDDGGRIPAQYQDCTISRLPNIKIAQYQDSQYQDLSYPREIQGLCGRMQQKIWQLSHRTYHGMQREFGKRAILARGA
jgi:hypothetical protein